MNDFATRLRSALKRVEQEGFGDDVDADSIIEEAAHRYLAQIEGEDR